MDGTTIVREVLEYSAEEAIELLEDLGQAEAVVTARVKGTEALLWDGNLWAVPRRLETRRAQSRSPMMRNTLA